MHLIHQSSCLWMLIERDSDTSPRTGVQPVKVGSRENSTCWMRRRKITACCRTEAVAFGEMLASRPWMSCMHGGKHSAHAPSGSSKELKGRARRGADPPSAPPPRASRGSCRWTVTSEGSHPAMWDGSEQIAISVLIQLPVFTVIAKPHLGRADASQAFSCFATLADMFVHDGEGGTLRGRHRVGCLRLAAGSCTPVHDTHVAFSPLRGLFPIAGCGVTMQFLIRTKRARTHIAVAGWIPQPEKLPSITIDMDRPGPCNCAPNRLFTS